MKQEAMQSVCSEIQEIMKTYREQEEKTLPVDLSTWETCGDCCQGGMTSYQNSCADAPPPRAELIGSKT